MQTGVDEEYRIFRRVLRRAGEIKAHQHREQALQGRVSVLATMTDLPCRQLKAMILDAEKAEAEERDTFFSVPFQLLLAGAFLVAAAIFLGAIARMTA
jgi:hypothetical protein